MTSQKFSLGIEELQRPRKNTFHSFYKRVPGSWCVYCAETATTEDHVPAVSAIESLGLSYFLERQIIPTRYPACKDCNVRLGAVSLYSIQQRKAYLLAKLKVKAGDINATRSISESEFNELGPTLQKMIRRIEQKQRTLLRRIDYLGNPEYPGY